MATEPEAPKPPERDALLPLRVALIMLFAVLSGVGAGVLVYLSGQHVAAAVLVGLGTAAAATKFFDWLIS